MINFLNTPVVQAIAAALNWNLRVNENFQSVQPAALYGVEPALTTGLTLSYFGGQFNGVTVAPGTLTLTASTTNYVVVHRTTGVVSAATTNTNFINTATYLPLYTFVTGATSITSGTDYRQAYGAGGTGSAFTGGTLTTGLNEAPPVTLASAATVNIGAAAANSITVTGTNAITAFDTIAAGALRHVTFTGILTLTYNATSLVLPGAASITTAAGDVAEMVSLGGGNWKCNAYERASGAALAGGGSFSGGTLTTALNEAPEVTLASAATVNIGAAAANTIIVTGTTTITAFDTIATGAIRRVRFTSSLTLTYNATSMILPGSANIGTAAGDVAFMESVGGGNWRCIAYFKGDGTALVGGGGGLTGATSALNVAAPNTVINASSITASGGSTNQDIALVPKGTGGILGQVADGTTAGGNRRGQYAVDWQHGVRGAAAQVASGDYSAIVGGLNVTASGLYSVAGGISNTASGQQSVAFGLGNTASGDGSLVTGSNCVADGLYSRVHGNYGSSRGIRLADIFGTNGGSILGQHQRENHGLLLNTTTTTPGVAVAYAGAASAANQVVLANNSAMTFSILVSAKKTGSTDTAHFKIEGGIVRGTSAATTAIVGTPVVTTLAAAAGASSWAVAVSANTTLGCLTVTVTGGAYAVEWDVQLLASQVILA